MEGQPFRVLFLSQRNSARSMMAEAIANSIGGGQIEAFSAGVRPAARVDPIAANCWNTPGCPCPTILRNTCVNSAPRIPRRWISSSR